MRLEAAVPTRSALVIGLKSRAHLALSMDREHTSATPLNFVVTWAMRPGSGLSKDTSLQLHHRTRQWS